MIEIAENDLVWFEKRMPNGKYEKVFGIVFGVWRNHKRQIQGVDLVMSDGTVGNVGAHALKVVTG